MKSVNENENMQKKLVSDEFTKLHCSSILYLHRIYIELSMIKNLKKKSIINLYLNYRNESGFSTRGVHVIRGQENPKMSKYAY